jgi:hypothetical protein
MPTVPALLSGFVLRLCSSLCPRGFAGVLLCCVSFCLGVGARCLVPGAVSSDPVPGVVSIVQDSPKIKKRLAFNCIFEDTCIFKADFMFWGFLCGFCGLARWMLNIVFLWL